MDRDKFRIRRIETVVDETPSIKTFRLPDPQSTSSNPGQFLMIWVPGSGEIPLAISGTRGDSIDLTVKARGSTTKDLHELGVGDKLGVRGPYGSGFSTPEGSSLLVGGGYGVAPLRYLYQEYVEGDNLSVVIGASSEEELLFLGELEPLVVATEDGSRGVEGRVVGPTKDVLEKRNIDVVYTSGPEMMIHGLVKMCREMDVGLEASLERIMKCGVGLCGSCLIDGFRVCQDGPVVDGDQLEEFEEFGYWERDFSGKRRPI